MTLATFGALYKKDFTHLAYNLKQSINLYRLDKDMNVELVVGDATDMFPDGSITGLGSGYYSHSNQYTAKATVWDPDKTDDNDGILFYSTLDESTILRPLASIMNGDVLNMSEEEWAEKINYLKVLIQLLLEKDGSGNTALVSLYENPDENDEADDTDDALDAAELTPKQEVAQALAAAQRFDELAVEQGFGMFDMNGSDDMSSNGAVTLTEEQTDALVEGIENGTIDLHSMDAQQAAELLALPYGMGSITDQLSDSGQDAIEAFTDIFEQIVDYYEELKNSSIDLPSSVTDVLDKILTKNNAKQLNALLTCLNALDDSVIGCDTYAITTDADGSNLNLVPVTLDGLGDSNNHTMRNFATTDDYLLFCTGNPVKGAQVWRLVDWPGKVDPTPDSDQYEVTLRNVGEGATGAGKYGEGDPVEIYAGTRSGYTFNGWVSDDVTISNADSKNASFIMPNHHVTVQAKWTRNSSGGHSSGSTLYTITVEDSKNGEVTSSHKQAGSGTTITLTVEADQGYVLDTLTVLDNRDKEVKLTEKDNGIYTFSMPSSDVTVQATFKAKTFFRDVPSGSYYEDAVRWAVENGITNGTGAATFGPNGVCTRAQIVTFLWRAAGSPEPKAMSSFTDVSASAYYAKAVAWAVENGITNGMTATEFAPDATCTRGQSVTFLYRALKGTASGSTSFTDVPANAFYADAVNWAVANNVTNGTSATTFSPNADCTRAEIVTFLYRAYQGK